MDLVETIYGAGVYEPPALSFPLSSEEGVLRPELVVTLLGCVKRNLNQRNQDLRLFEVGKVFPRRPGSDERSEERRLGLAVLGSQASRCTGAEKDAPGISSTSRV